MFAPKEYVCSTTFSGTAAKAFDVARTALLSLGFEILVDSETELKAVGPGMHSNRQPDLLGISLLRIKISSSRISARAILGGVAKMKTFVYLFPPGLIIALFIINTLFGAKMPWWTLLMSLPWLLIAPLIGGALERKTTKALDRLVNGMAQAKGPK